MKKETRQATNAIGATLMMWVLMGCDSKAQDIPLQDLLKQSPQQVLTSRKVPFQLVPMDSVPNYAIRLYGEKMPEKATQLLSPEYIVDWERESIQPAISYAAVPLQAPKLLLDSTGNILVAIAEIGNDGPKGEKKAGVFSDDDVITLKTALSKQLGKEKMVRENSYNGNVYVWQKDKLTARLTIENEKFENTSKSRRNGIPQDGRHGTLTIYNGVSPEFFSEDENYFKDPEIRK